MFTLFMKNYCNYTDLPPGMC